MIWHASNPLEQFQWKPQPEAEQVIQKIIQEYLDRMPPAARLAQRMREQTGTRFADWIDHLILPAGCDYERQLQAAGFVLMPQAHAEQCLVHEGGLFPAVLVAPGEHFEAAIRVEDVADFAVANHLSLAVRQPPLSLYRRLLAGTQGPVALWAVERHGYRGFDQPIWTNDCRAAMLRHREHFRTRQRDFADDREGFVHLVGLLDDAIGDCGRDVACDLFFAAEREYWQGRNRAARIQKARQDRLGLGWANHDHHTYRSSREHFARLIAILEKLGFQCRERFYAGAEAGWGAQVLEQPAAGIVVFADVDLWPDELVGDFAHEPMRPRDGHLGTVGLWCALHGEAILQAGMHHLECQFDFRALAEQLQAEADIRTMPPFTDLPYLRQAFTEGEHWAVREERLQRLLAQGHITAEQATRFRSEGAVGSHLENLQRDQGFKGFNQRGVSQIIAATDPRQVGRPEVQGHL